MNAPIRLLALTLAATACSVSLTACGSSNDGGSTSCGDFVKMSTSDQKDVIKKYLEDEDQSTSNGNVTVTRLSATAYCSTVGSDSDPISDISHG